jgi:hypothetical protein
MVFALYAIKVKLEPHSTRIKPLKKKNLKREVRLRLVLINDSNMRDSFA